MGIANIINTAGGGGGGGSEIITNLVNSVDGAGLRLANQGYISCADVSANRFGTNDFSVEFVLSQETNAVNADIFISNLNGSNQAVDAAVIRWDVVQNDNIQLVFTNSGASETAYNFGYDPAPDLNEPTHYLVSADRSGNAVLYRNGAEIASVSIAASGSANVGNSGQPTVIGSPVNNFGVKGNVYRLRTYSKALSSDEAKNVFDRADVPTALVSNLLLDLDCAYANPTQSTVIQDRGPNNQDGTLNGTITQTNVIKQLNSVSARIGTTAATPADGAIVADNVGIGVAPDVKLAIKDNVDNTNESGIRLLRSANSDCGWINMRGGAFNINTRNNAANAGLPVKVKMHGTEVFTIDSAGNAIFKKGGGAYLQLSDASAVRGSINVTDSDGLIFTTGASFTTAMTIDSSGQLGVGNSAPTAPLEVSKSAASTESVISTFSTTDADHSILNFKKSGSATIGTKAVTADGEVLGSIGAYGVDTNSDQRRSAQIQFNQAAASTGSKVAGNIVFKTSSTSANDAERMRIDSTGQTTITSSNQNVLYVNRQTSNGDVIVCEYGGVDRLRLGTEGITFPNGGTAPAAAAANQLDYYEEGTWTPSLVRNGAAITAGVAYSNQAGNYTRIGNVVYYWFDMTISTLDNSTLNPASGTFGIGGLPFTSAAATAGGYGAPSFRSMTAVASSIRNNNNSSFVQTSSTYIALFWFNGSAVEIGLDDVTTDLTTGRLTGEGFYFTS
jgi:hypothetical protein